MTPIRVRPVVSKSDFRSFVRFPWTVYAGDPCWVPPLLIDIKDRMNRSKHPFFEHAEAEYFLAERDGRVVGRVAAVVDRNHNAFHEEKVVFFGFYESLDDPETSRALLDAAAAWGARRGMRVLRGPTNLSPNDELAMLVDGFDAPPAIMMPYNPRYYPTLMAAAGMAKAKDLFAYELEAKTDPAPLRALIERSRRELPNVLVRRAVKRRFRDEADRIMRVYNSGWEKNWGFVPWTPNEMTYLVKTMKLLADPDLVIFAEVAGEPVGFAFALPNYNEVLARMNGRLLPFGWARFLSGRRKIHTARILVFGLVPEYRRTGLSYLLFDEIKRSCVGRGIRSAELSWLLEDNEPILRFNASLGAVKSKTYRVYEKPI